MCLTFRGAKRVGFYGESSRQLITLRRSHPTRELIRMGLLADRGGWVARVIFERPN
jgi:hypothetical protein